MKIIFLDIDGVLNCDHTPNPRKFPYVVDPGLLDNLNVLIARTGARVVLSSTWRTDPVGVLAARHFGVPFVDMTPDDPGASRCAEMKRWLSDHPDVERYIVIDDKSDCLDDEPLFQTLSATGLTMEIVEAAARYLNGETDELVLRPAIIRMGQNVYALFNRDKS
jgi:hypothetical protein